MPYIERATRRVSIGAVAWKRKGKSARQSVKTVLCQPQSLGAVLGGKAGSKRMSDTRGVTVNLRVQPWPCQCHSYVKNNTLSPFGSLFPSYWGNVLHLLPVRVH